MRLIAAALVAAVLALLNLANLAGTAYAGLVSRNLDNPRSPATQEAARIAARWPPWSPNRAALLGWLRAENGDADGATRAYRRALHLAPGDPLLWAEYGLALARLGDFGTPMTVAVRQALRLAPASPAVRGAVADMGISYWRRGDAEQQRLWLEAMRAERAAHRGSLLARVLTRGQAQTFCSGPARALDEAAWCARMASAIASGCYELKPAEPVPCATRP